ncbi:MAG TPA: thiamine-phosphate kinase [Thermoplasmata archaeon]|nr:thiamine-phosphate kinase [Thermoplasmata archaeon]
MPVRRAPKTKPIEERRFHDWLARTLPAGRSGLLPLGDDAAAIRPPAGKVAVLSIDSLVEGTHFLAGAPPRKIGAAAAAVSLSDLAAKGAEPAALLLAIVLPPGTPQGWAEAVAIGAERMAARFGMELVGGDTKPGPMRTVVSSVVGWADEGTLAPRSGARIGDVLATTGYVGRGGVAAARLGRAKRPRPHDISAMLEVNPRVAEGAVLVRWAHAMLDTSDGLAEASRLLAEASGVRIEVDEDRLPLTPSLRKAKVSAAQRRRRAFYGGDYELLLTLPGRAFPAAELAVRGVGGRLTAIGRATRGRGAWLRCFGGLRPMPSAGWRPFARGTRRLI